MTETFIRLVDPVRLKGWIHDGHEIALLDIREHGQFGEDHLFFAIPLPYSQLEADLHRLVPRKTVRVVLYADQASNDALQASARALHELGYSQCYVLDGGIEAWKAAGFGTFAGVNLPSKTFGELAEHVYHTPSVTAQQLHAWMQQDGQKLVILDGRPVDEYRKMNIPGAICCPNGELALRAQEIAPDPETTIVINCAGRTRSIIGAQTLINLHVPNPVFALENGTQGWYLADLPLEHGSDRIYPEVIADETAAVARQRAAALKSRLGLETVSAQTVGQWLQEGEHSVFVCDVRTREEFERDALPALVQHTPGGQLIQATDQYVGVRQGRLVLCDLDGVRAPVVASWLKQLGWAVVLLEDVRGLSTLPAPAQYSPVLRSTRRVSAHEVWQVHQSNPSARIVDLRTSMQYRQKHVAQAIWSIRSVVSEHIPDNASTVILLGAHYSRLCWIAHDLERRGVSDIYLCDEPLAALERAGFETVTTPNSPPDDQCIDYLFFVHDRHDGNKAAARQYLEWETNLIAQLDDAERNAFALPVLAE